MTANIQIRSTLPPKPQRRRLEPEDRRAFWGGILISLIFTGLIWAGGCVLNRPDLLPDQGASWYYWKRPDPTFWSRFSAWTLYALQQVASWGLIAHAQTRVKRYTRGLHTVNKIALGVNALFILLHFAQSQMHDVPLPKWLKWRFLFLGAYIVGALVTYSLRDITMLHQVTWIPIIEYAGVFVLAGLITAGIKPATWLRPTASQTAG